MSVHNKNYTLPIIAAVIVLAIPIAIVLFTLLRSDDEAIPSQTTQAATTPDNSAVINLENSSANLLKAGLNVYYTNYGKYLVTYGQFKDYMRESQKDSYDSLVDAEGSLTDLDYSARGNGEAYKLTYRSVSGETITVEGNYLEEYH